MGARLTPRAAILAIVNQPLKPWMLRYHRRVGKQPGKEMTVAAPGWIQSRVSSRARHAAGALPDQRRNARVKALASL